MVPQCQFLYNSTVEAVFEMCVPRSSHRESNTSLIRISCAVFCSDDLLICYSNWVTIINPQLSRDDCFYVIRVELLVAGASRPVTDRQVISHGERATVQTAFHNQCTLCAKTGVFTFYSRWRSLEIRLGGKFNSAFPPTLDRN